MVRELRNIIEDIASIDTSVDIEDVKAIAQFNKEADAKITELREFLLTLPIKSTPITVSEVTYTETDANIIQTSEDFKELIDLGCTPEQLTALHNIYTSRKSAKKMSFVVCIKCCKFIVDEIEKHKNKILKINLVPTLRDYLRIIDPTTNYNLCNIHDFLRGAALGAISSKFFKLENGYLIGVN